MPDHPVIAYSFILRLVFVKVNFRIYHMKCVKILSLVECLLFRNVFDHHESGRLKGTCLFQRSWLRSDRRSSISYALIEMMGLEDFNEM